MKFIILNAKYSGWQIFKSRMSTYHLQRSERLRSLGQPTPRAKWEAKGIVVNRQVWVKREAEKSWSTYHLERSERLKRYWWTFPLELSERLRRLDQPTSSSGARGWKGIDGPSTSSGARGWGVLVNLPHKVVGWPRLLRFSLRSSWKVHQYLLSLSLRSRWKAYQYFFSLSLRSRKKVDQ